MSGRYHRLHSFQPPGLIAGNLSIAKTDETSMPAFDNGGELVFAYGQVRFLFCNPRGSRLIATRRTVPDFEMEAWSIEEFEVV